MVEPIGRLVARAETQQVRLTRARIRAGRARSDLRNVRGLEEAFRAVQVASAALPRGYRRLVLEEANRLVRTADEVLEAGLDGGVIPPRRRGGCWTLETTTYRAGMDLEAIVSSLTMQLRDIEAVAAIEAASDGYLDAQAQVTAAAKLAAIRELLEDEAPHETFAGARISRARALAESRRDMRTA